MKDVIWPVLTTGALTVATWYWAGPEFRQIAWMYVKRTFIEVFSIVL